MRHIVSRILLFTLLLPLLAACDLESTEPELDDPDLGASSPALLVGTWTLESMTDRTGETFGETGRNIPAGQATAFTVSEGGQSITATFLIEGAVTFSTERYTVELDIAISVAGLGSSTESTSDSGSYIVDGNTMTITSDTPDPDDPGPNVITWAIDSGDLILEDEETRMRFSK